MTATGPADEAREIARVLTRSLDPLLAPVAPHDAFVVAREVAQMLALEGLDRLLGACEPFAGAPWPESIEPAIHRLARLCAASEEAGAVAPFVRADLELSGLAAELEALLGPPADEPGPAASHAVPTLAASDVLGDLPLEGADDARALQRVRLTTAVAGALRAALDWLAGAEGPRRALKLTVEDSMLEVWVSNIDPLGLRAASEVLAAADGNLGPVGGAAPPGTWRVRVPAHAARDAFLMLIQGGLPLALPWHAVLHVHLMPEAAIPDAYPPAVVIPPLAPLGASAGDRPVIMLAHGLRRAWLVADRLVWRFPAEPCAAVDPPPAVALAGLVRTDEGESWWRVDVARLLAGIEPLSVPDAPRALVSDVPPAPVAPPDVAAPMEESAPPPPEPILLGPDAVTPEPAPAPVATPAPPASRPTPAARDSRSTRAWHPHTPPPPGELPPPKVELIAPAPREPRPVPAPPALRRLVRAEVEPLPAPPPPRAPLNVIPVAPVVAEPGVVAPLVAEPAPLMPTVLAPVVAEPEVVAPVVAAPEVVAPVAAAPAAPEPEVVAPVVAEPAPGERPRRALVIEDSMMARLFLVRMLQKRGFQVDAVDTAAAISPALARGPWGLVCLDVELPDARGIALAIAVREQLEHAHSPAVLVALVRDPADLAVARGASIPHSLRKPFAEIELDALLSRLGQERAR